MFIKVKYILIAAGLASIAAYASFDYDAIYENVNTWYKVSTDEMNPGEVVALDMSQGYSTCNEGVIYIIVREVGMDERVVVVLPDGGYWSAPEVDTTSVEIQRHFGKLEQDLRQR